MFLYILLKRRLYITKKAAVMAEWLRRLTRNQMGSSRVGSNPTHSEKIFFAHLLKVDVRSLFSNKKTKSH